MIKFSSGFQFPLLDSIGVPTSVVVDMEDMFVRKELFLDAGLWAAGSNVNGQLGDGTLINKSSPVQVGSLTNWRLVAGGANHTAAVKTDGTLWTWGSNSNGQLGDGTLVDKSSPVQLAFNADANINGVSYNRIIRQVACGDSHTAIIAKSTNTLYTWGKNTNGQLGLGYDGYSEYIPNFTDYASSRQSVITSCQQVACGANHTAAIDINGSLYAWGDSTYGQTGSGDWLYPPPGNDCPTRIGLGTNWRQVACGANHTAAIKINGTLWAFGLNTSGQLGDGTVINQSSPVQVGALTTWRQVACGANHTAAINTDGTLWTWGSNSIGQLGDSTTVSKSSPVQVGSLANWRQVAASALYTGAVKTDGTLWTWGNNTSGQLADGTTASKSSPIQVGSAQAWRQVAAGNQHIVAVQTPDLF